MELPFDNLPSVPQCPLAYRLNRTQCGRGSPPRIPPVRDRLTARAPVSATQPLSQPLHRDRRIASEARLPHAPVNSQAALCAALPKRHPASTAKILPQQIRRLVAESQLDVGTSLRTGPVSGRRNGPGVACVGFSPVPLCGKRGAPVRCRKCRIRGIPLRHVVPEPVVPSPAPSGADSFTLIFAFGDVPWTASGLMPPIVGWLKRALALATLAAR